MLPADHTDLETFIFAQCINTMRTNQRLFPLNLYVLLEHQDHSYPGRHLRSLSYWVLLKWPMARSAFKIVIVTFLKGQREEQCSHSAYQIDLIAPCSESCSRWWECENPKDCEWFDHVFRLFSPWIHHALKIQGLRWYVPHINLNPSCPQDTGLRWCVPHINLNPSCPQDTGLRWYMPHINFHFVYTLVFGSPARGCTSCTGVNIYFSTHFTQEWFVWHLDVAL